MTNHVFSFKTKITEVNTPNKLNNPFGKSIPEIAQLAATEFQAFIETELANWEHDFETQKGKMFGVLVIQKQNGDFGYLGTVSGKLSGNSTCNKFVPSVFDESTKEHFFSRGMIELSELSNQINSSKIQVEIEEFKEIRKQKSSALQHRLFENYKFQNIKGLKQNVIEIFEASSQGNPPAATGECAAPKLLQFAFENELKPIAIAEFWWGNSPKSNKRKHKNFYPACKNKCRPILEFMLNDFGLYNTVESRY